METDDHSHPSRDSSEWEMADFCPFCGVQIRDAGAGFMEHIETATTCHERFEAWRENVVDDIGGEWGG